MRSFEVVTLPPELVPPTISFTLKFVLIDFKIQKEAHQTFNIIRFGEYDLWKTKTIFKCICNSKQKLLNNMSANAF